MIAAPVAGAPALLAADMPVAMALPFVNVLPAGFWVTKDRGFFRKSKSEP